MVQKIYTVVANSTCSGLKPLISPSNVAQNANPGTVLETARPEDSKTTPTCQNWLIDWYIWGQRQMIWF